MSKIALSERFSDFAARYDVMLCDVWGVVHNSLVAWPQAHDALSRFRAKGGAVVLITNAPRPGGVVRRQLDRLGVPGTAYDGIVSSGEVTRAVIADRPGRSVLHIGPQRDLPLYSGLGVTFADEANADYAVCTGLFDDESETPEHYRGMFGTLRARDTFMLCANPDLVVERGTQLIYCAGALADFYRSLGGDVLYAGKPHAPIYQRALQHAAEALGRTIPRDRVVAIGDSIRTDMTGAGNFGIDSVFITAGIHAEEFGDRDAPNTGALAAAFARENVRPTVVMRALAW